MDNSDDAFRAAKRTIELIKNGNLNEECQVDSIEQPEITAFHSTDHRKLSQTIALYVPSTFGANYPIPPVDYRKIKAEYEQHGRDILDKTEKLFEKNNIEVKAQLITDKKPEDFIKEQVEEDDVDLVVLGSKGEHSKLEQIFSGTIAQKVLNEVPCDVLIVR